MKLEVQSYRILRKSRFPQESQRVAAFTDPTESAVGSKNRYTMSNIKSADSGTADREHDRNLRD